MAKQFLNPAALGAAGAPFSQGVRSGNTVWVSAQAGQDAHGSVVGGNDPVAQCRAIFERVGAVLAAGGAAPEHLVSLTWYVTDIEDYVARQKDIGRAYRDTIGKHFPAMALGQVVRLVERRAKVEIQAMAVVPRDA
jgi:enamine deaminase RidA (YjgF/YER057c/UK114 family)